MLFSFNDPYAYLNVDRSAIFSTQNYTWFFWLIFIILLLILVYFLRIFYRNKIFRNLQSVLTYLKFLIAVVLISAFLLIFCFNILVIEITSNADDAALIWMVAIALILGAFTTVVMSTAGFSKTWMKFSGLVVFLIFAIGFQFGYIGVRIIIRIPAFIPLIFWHNVFETNTPNGILFIRNNIGLFGLIFFISHTTEGEKTH